jgi:hypothetical protein
MSLGLLFWILMLLWVVGYGYGTFRTPNPSWPVIGPNILLFILLLLLGWQAFGPPIK